MPLLELYFNPGAGFKAAEIAAARELNLTAIQPRSDSSQLLLGTESGQVSHKDC